nr:J domain-containing protein [Sphingomonas sp. ABOLG]
MLTPYEILGLQPGAEPEVVEAAYRALMKKYHPDRWSGSPELAHRRAQEINAAYASVKNGSVSAAEPIPSTVRADPSLAPTITAPFNIGRNLAWATGLSAAIVAIAAAVGSAR